MIYAYDFARRADEVGEDDGQVAGAGADVEDASVWVEMGEEGFGGRGVHVGRRDCGTEADELGRILVRDGGGIVSAVDLGDGCQLSVSRQSQGVKDCCRLHIEWKRLGRTASIAFLTRSDVMRPLFVRFLIRPAFVEPVDIQAMISGLVEGMGMWLETD